MLCDYCVLAASLLCLETRLHQAQAEPMAPIDFLSCLVSDELTRRGDRLLERRRKQAQFRDPQATLAGRALSIFKHIEAPRFVGL